MLIVGNGFNDLWGVINKSVLIAVVNIQLMLFGAGLALSQVPGLAPVPGLEVENFDDWSVVCGKSVEGPRGIVSPNERLCEVVTVVTKSGETTPFVRISLLRQEIVKPIRIVAIVPAAVSIPSGLSLMLAPGKPSVNLNYKFCATNACVAEGEIPEEQMVTFQDSLLIGNLTFSDPNGNKIEVKVSFKGLIQALNGMQK